MGEKPILLFSKAHHAWIVTVTMQKSVYNDIYLLEIVTSHPEFLSPNFHINIVVPTQDQACQPHAVYICYNLS